MLRRTALAALIAVLFINVPVWSAISIGSPDDCDEGQDVVFDELGVINPQYTVSGVPIYDTVTVSMGSFFAGQTLGTFNNTLDNTVPSGPLRLAANAPNVETLFDLANPTSIVVGGSDEGKYYTTPLAILFDNPVSHVCFNLGDLDANSPTLIEAFAADGTSLGTVDDLAPGTNRYSIGGGPISGVSIYIPDADGGMDWEGFGVSDLSFSAGVVPEPGTVVIWALLGLAAFSAAFNVSRQRDFA